MRLRFVHRCPSAFPVTVCFVLGFVVLSGWFSPSPRPTATPAPTVSTPAAQASCDSSPGNRCNVTVDFASDVACAPPPVVTGQPHLASLTLTESWTYPINATEFCGTSMFYNYTTAGAVHVGGYNYGNGSGTLIVLGNGTVMANYITEPTGMFPVMFFSDDWSDGPRINWTASVGEYRVSSDEPYAVVAVPNGTYNVSVTGRFCGTEGLPASIVMNGTGARLPFHSFCFLPLPPSLHAQSPPSFEADFAPYDLLLLVFAMFAGVGLAIATMVEEGRRRV